MQLQAKTSKKNLVKKPNKQTISKEIKNIGKIFRLKDAHSNKFSSLVDVIGIATDKNSIACSVKLIEQLDFYAYIMPKEKIKSSELSIIKDSHNELLKLKELLEDFLYPLNTIIDKDIILDNKSVCQLIDNLNTCIGTCLFICDYLDLIIEVHNNIEEVKSKDAVSFKDLKSLLNKAA